MEQALKQEEGWAGTLILLRPVRVSLHALSPLVPIPWPHLPTLPQQNPPHGCGEPQPSLCAPPLGLHFEVLAQAAQAPQTPQQLVLNESSVLLAHPNGPGGISSPTTTSLILVAIFSE